MPPYQPLHLESFLARFNLLLRFRDGRLEQRFWASPRIRNRLLAVDRLATASVAINNVAILVGMRWPYGGPFYSYLVFALVVMAMQARTRCYCMIFTDWCAPCLCPDSTQLLAGAPAWHASSQCKPRVTNALTLSAFAARAACAGQCSREVPPTGFALSTCLQILSHLSRGRFCHRGSPGPVLRWHGCPSDAASYSQSNTV